MKTAEYDVVIVGAGLAGASLALALKNTSLKIALIETFPIQTDSQPNYDDRGIALSYSSSLIFETMDIWPNISHLASPINTIHVSDRGHFGVTHIHAQQEKVPALGYVITAKALGHQLNTMLQSLDNVTLLCPRRVLTIDRFETHVTLHLSDNTQVSSKLVVAADGKESDIRQLLELSTTHYDYQQTAITANISTDKPTNGMAYERFTASGPVALLPLGKDRWSLVWTVKTGDELEIINLSEEAFLMRLQRHFGYRAGRFNKVGKRQSHTLDLMQTDYPLSERTVLIGNAAHSLHPIAGQGFNLGLRDVAALAEVICEAEHDIGDMRLLKSFQDGRLLDQDTTIKATDTLVKLFSHSNPILSHLRSASLTLVDNLPFAKSHLARKSMGLNIKQSKLARGISL